MEYLNKVLPHTNYGETNFITGLRAYAALAVVLIHSGGGGIKEFNTIGQHIVNLGQTGVYTFFVISGFSISASFVSSSSYADYLSKRIWRIIPLYYFWIIGALLCSFITSSPSSYWQEHFHVRINAYNLFMHFSLLNFLDYKITNSILGVEWSISVEVAWYLLVPTLLLLSKNLRVLGSLILITMGITLASEMLAARSVIPYEAIHWNPLPYGICYMLGIVAFKLRAYKIQNSKMTTITMAVALALLLLYVSEPNLVLKAFKNEIILISLITCALLTFGSEKNRLFCFVFANPVVLFLGTISYGIYLCHMPILGFLKQIHMPLVENLTARFLILATIATAISTITYHLVEKPGLAWGRKISRRLMARFSVTYT